MSGSLYRNKLKYAAFKRKRLATSPRKAHRHWRAPSKILWKTIRGVVPHKTHRGACAMDRLKVFDGIPHPYDAKKRKVVPAALKCLRLKNHRKFCKPGDLSHEYGWKAKAIVQKLEAQRKVKSEEYYKTQKADLEAQRKVKSEEYYKK